MSEMIEKLAMALCDDVQARKNAYETAAPSFADSAPYVQRYWRRIARAALEALRDPTDEMVEAGREHGWGVPVEAYMADVPAIFTAMIDRALQEKEG